MLKIANFKNDSWNSQKLQQEDFKLTITSKKSNPKNDSWDSQKFTKQKSKNFGNTRLSLEIPKNFQNWWEKFPYLKNDSWESEFFTTAKNSDMVEKASHLHGIQHFFKNTRKIKKIKKKRKEKSDNDATAPRKEELTCLSSGAAEHHCHHINWKLTRRNKSEEFDRTSFSPRVDKK